MVQALSACEEITSRSRFPLFVGGTGLYIDALFRGLSEIPDVPDEVRQGLDRDIRERGLDSLYRELQGVDTVFASRIHPHDRQRIIRALAVYRTTGHPFSGFMGKRRGYGSDQTLYIGLDLDRDELRTRIIQRVDGMIAKGLVDEVRELRNKGYGPELRSMQSIGYGEIHRYLDGKWSLDDAVHEIKRATVAYAKRQHTWFSRNDRIHWVAPGDIKAVKEFISRWLEQA